MRESEEKTRVFLRDDDVGEVDSRLRTFVDIFASRNLPVSYQIIPKSLSEDCAVFLRSSRAEAPHLFEFSQHGLSHEMTIGGKQVFYEFGPERNYDEQLAIIRAGQDILAARLGSDFNRAVFTPPQHKYDRNTLRALKACGVDILSASSYSTPHHRAAYFLGRLLGISSVGRSGISYHGRIRPDSGLIELSIGVPVDNGSEHGASASDVVRAVDEARKHTAIVGLMFHHNAYAGDEGRAFLSELADRLHQLPRTSFHLLSDLQEIVISGEAHAQ